MEHQDYHLTDDLFHIPIDEVLHELYQGNPTDDVVWKKFQDRTGTGNRHIKEKVSTKNSLLKSLGHRAWEVRAEAITKLAQEYGQQAIAPIIECLRQDAMPEVRAVAARALGELKASEAESELLDALDDFEQEVRTAAAQALGKLKSPRSHDAIAILKADFLAEDDATTRTAIIATLGEQQEYTPVDILDRGLKDADWQVREAAAEAMRKQGDRANRAALEAVLNDESAFVSQAAISALEKISKARVKNEAPMGAYTGQRFGDYHLVRFLGGGNFGDVYYAEQVHKKTPAAIKVFKTKLTPDKFKEFINEIYTVLLKHPNIVPIIGFGIREEDELGYLVMEYAPNGTLLVRHPRGTRLPLPAIVTYVNQIAAALQYAHDQRRIHRDVKPGNVLLGAKNELLLSDFGLAVVAHDPISQRTEERSGTAAYMAPEQWRGKPLPASDQYALGIMVYEWLCGERPFKGDTLRLQYQHTMEPVPPLHEKNQTIPPEVEQVVMKALAKKPQDRYQSIQEFAEALEGCVKPPDAPPPQPPYNPVWRDLLAVGRYLGIVGSEIASYKPQWRDLLAVVLTAGLYLGIAGAAIYALASLSSPLGDVARIVLWILPFIMGILAGVSSGRKGFDGLVPALMSGLAGGCVFLSIASALLGTVPLEDVLLDLVIYASLSLLGATMYVGIKKIWVRFRQ